MERTERAEFTVMCLVKDGEGRLLLEDRVDPEWPGVTNGYYPQQRTVVGGLEVSF